MILARLLAIALWGGIGLPAATWTAWIEPCTAEAAQASGCEAGDTELARWALDAWSKQSGGAVAFKAVSAEDAARLRMHWVSGTGALYGETRRFDFHGLAGAEVYVLPQIASHGDHLLRDAIVYLTCVHESGHALGLPHTDGFADIMYSFQYGGDIPEYFGRYRRKLQARADIARNSGLSAHDGIALLAALQETP